jgi:luciferase family oxidoreductase group 1
MSTIELGVLDFCFRATGQAGSERLAETLHQATIVDELGYSRYWVVEHHGPEVAHASPELLIPLILGQTKQLRAGPAGILLTYYSPFKVADSFRTLEALFPGRVDLGVGRGQVDPATAAALMDSATVDQEYQRKVADLVGHVRGALPPGHPYADAQASPSGAQSPDVWVLASGGTSVPLAARLGACCSIGLFQRQAALGADPTHLRQYRERFQPSPALACPRANIAVAGVVAETKAEAQAILRTHANPSIVPYVVGTPDECRAQIEGLAAIYGADEVIFGALGDSHAARLQSYRLLAQAFGLSTSTATAEAA